MSGKTDIAEDVAQDVALKMYLGLEQYDRERPFWVWFRVVVKNHFIDVARRERSRCESPLDDASLAAGKADTAPSQEEQLASQQRLAQLRELMGLLPDRLRQIAQLFYSEQLSYQEIAETCGVRIGTVGARLNEARDILKRRMSELRASTPPGKSKRVVQFLNPSKVSEQSMSSNASLTVRHPRPAHYEAGAAALSEPIEDKDV